jgi:transcriptional regulator with XRE-family HTH domain
MGICADAVVLQGHFSFFENGKVEPSISRLGKLAAVGEVSIREFFKNGKWD